MLSPSGTPETYFDTGSLSASLPSWASCRTTAEVIVLVFEAIRKWVSASGGLCTPSSVVPDATVKSPCGVLSITTAPGISCSLMELSTSACNALWSIVFRPEPGAAVDVAADADDADDADAADDVEATADDVATGAAADVVGVAEDEFDELLHPAATSESAAAAAMSAFRRRPLVKLLAVIFSVVVIAIPVSTVGMGGQGRSMGQSWPV